MEQKEMAQMIDDVLSLLHQLEDATRYGNKDISRAVNAMQKCLTTIDYSKYYHLIKQ